MSSDERIIEKLTNVLEELEFMNQNCPREVGLRDCHTICDQDFDCTECWIEALACGEKEGENE